MKRVQQVLLDRGAEALERSEEPGDCMRAAVASIFELELVDVPHFADTGPRRDGNALLWLYAWHGWALTKGVIVRHFEVHDAEHLALPGYCVLSGISPRAEPGTTSLRHCCVAWNGELVWDPHPSGAGLLTIDEADYLVPITDDACALLARDPDEVAA